jgi:hypothetical protein
MPEKDKLDTISNLKHYIGIYYPNAGSEGIECVREVVRFVSNWELLGDDLTAEYVSLSPIEYWTVYGKSKYPLLGPIAIRMFSSPTSSAASERVWSVYAFIHSKRRNRLSNAKVEKLAYIYINSSLLDDVDKVDYFSTCLFEDEDI